MSDQRAARAVAFGPGRVNLIGEHTDYNDGLALPFAIALGVTVEAVASGDDAVVAVARDRGEEDRFALRDPESAPGWRAFVRGAVAELQRAGAPPVGCRLEISGTVPEGSGLSSSAALEVALCLALLAVARVERPSRLELARLCARIETEWVGAQTGLLDQLASLHGARGHASLIDFRTFEVTPVPLDLRGWTLATLDSGETHSLAESGYNERRAECERARERLGLSSLRDATLGALGALPTPLADRARHVIEENARVEAAAAAVRAGDVASLGPLLTASHASLRDLYAASTPAVEAAVATLEAAGAAGARMVGGGFGGHVLGLFPPGIDPPPACLVVAPSAGPRVVVGSGGGGAADPA